MWPFWLKLRGGGRHCTHHRGTVSALAGQDVSVARESRLTLLVRRPHPVRPPADLARPPEGLLLAIGGRHPSSLDMRQEVQEVRRPCRLVKVTSSSMPTVKRS